MKRIMLLGALICLCLVSASAQNFIEKGDSLYNVIVTNSDVDITFVNDALHPWSVENDAVIIRGKSDQTYSTSWLTMSFNVEEKSELTFEWACYCDYDHSLNLFIDGAYDSQTTNSNYQFKRFILDPGTHVIAFKDTVGYRRTSSDWSGIKNVQIKTIVPDDFNPIVTTSDADNITFNFDNWFTPWKQENNIALIRYTGDNNFDNTYSSSWLTLSFTLDEKAEMSFEWACYCDYDHSLNLFIDGAYDSQTTNSNYQFKRFILDPGTHVIAFKDTVGYRRTSSDWSGIKNVQIKTIVPDDFNPIVTTSDADNIIFNFDNWFTPWKQEDNVAIIRYTGNNNYDNTYSSSWLTLSFTLDEKAEMSFEWACHCDYDHSLNLFIDGVYDSQTTNSNYQSKHFFLDPGEHVIAFKDTVGYRRTGNDWSGIKNVKIIQVKPLAPYVLTDDSESITFQNKSNWPWLVQDGYIKSGNYGFSYTTSRFSTTFTLDKTSLLSYKVLIPDYDYFYTNDQYTSRHTLYVDINGKQWDYWESKRDWTEDRITLEPGSYTIEWIDTIRANNSSYNLWSQIKDIKLTNNWVDVELATAGTLGVEVLYKVDILNDVELLKIKGPMNATDWATIKQMNNLSALDLSEAIFEALPDNVFDGMTWLGSVILPEGLKTIGSYAFKGTRMMNINIPSTVVSIGRSAFENVSQLRSLSFAENSQLKTIDMFAFQNCSKLQSFVLPDQLVSIGFHAFYQCTSIEKVVIPNSVTSIEAYAFYGCSNLKSIRFSDSMTEIRQWICCNCYSLSDVQLPVGLTYIGAGAFQNAINLHHIDFPGSLRTIAHEVFNNSALDSIVLPVKLQYLGTSSFDNCQNLRYIEFPSYLERGNYIDRYYYSDGSYYNREGSSGYRSNFRNCPSIETVVMRSATPPIIDADPFESSRVKSSITLKVPSFAVVNYKLDSYWYQFGSITEGDNVDYWRIVNPLSLTNNRRMQGKPDIDLYYGGQFTVGGNAPMETGLFNYYVLESNPGRLLNTCDAMTADSINTYFSVSANTWYFICPIHDVDLTKVSVSNGASYVFRYYDGSSRATNGTGNSWRNVDSGKLLAGQGYIFRSNVDAIITMPTDADGHKAMFNTADVTKQLSEYEAAASANKSWNYVGNPYPCYYDIYYMDYTAPITVWTGSTYKAYSLIDDNYALRPMQSFFVQKPDAVDNIVFHKEGRQLTADINHASSASNAPARSSRFLFDLVLSNDSESDETRVVINDNASMEYELERDASKFMSIDASVPQLFTLDMADNSYAINERPLDNGLVRMAYSAGQSGYLTISASRLDGDLFITDNQTEKTVNLKEQDYTFHTNATNGVDANRFTLTLMPANNGETFVKEQHPVSDEQSPVFDILGRKMEQPLENGLFIQDGKIIMK